MNSYHMKFLLALIVLIVSLDAFACKERKYRDKFPLEEVKHYDHLLILQIQNISYSAPSRHPRYTPPFTFSAKVVKSYLGPITEGTIVQGSTGSEEPHAVCAVKFIEGERYIVMIKGMSEPYVVNRHSFRVSETHPMYELYNIQLENIRANIDEEDT